jgi:hypothetical protein
VAEHRECSVGERPIGEVGERKDGIGSGHWLRF